MVSRSSRCSSDSSKSMSLPLLSRGDPGMIGGQQPEACCRRSADEVPERTSAGKPVDGPQAAAKAVPMTSRISHTSFDARDAYAQSVFWSQVLGFTEDPDDPNEPGHEECLIISPDRSELLQARLPDGRAALPSVRSLTGTSGWPCPDRLRARPAAPFGPASHADPAKRKI